MITALIRIFKIIETILSSQTGKPNGAKFSDSLFSHLGDGEESDPGEDDEGHGVEPAADVGEEPEGQAELDRVEDVLDEDKLAHLGDHQVQLVSGALGNGINLLLGDRGLNT